MKTIRTDRARETFLAQISEVPNVSAACRAAGIARSAAYEWKREDKDFSAAWDDAIESAVDDLEQVAWERAKDQSDRMLEILLKAHRGDKYIEKHKVEQNGDISVTIRDLSRSNA